MDDGPERGRIIQGKAVTDYTREELDWIAKRTRDPSTLSDEMIARMKELRVGPWVHSGEEWDKALGLTQMPPA